MRLGHSLNLEQKQKLIVTTELRQAIELLQMNSMEIDSFINKEIMENPMLEIEARKEDINWKDYFAGNSPSSVNSGFNYRDEDDRPSFDNYIKEEELLEEYLIRQLRSLKLSEEEYYIGEILIFSLDEDGYLKDNLEKLEKNTKIPIEKLSDVLEIIKTFEPIGIGGHNLEECLKIQAKHDKKDTYIFKIIGEHLEDIAYNRIEKISSSLGISTSKTREAISYIKSLNPKPGVSFSPLGHNSIQYVVPDGKIEKIDGKFEIILNEETSPKLILNNYYRSLLENSEDESIIKYLDNRLNRALWVIKSIEQRRNTIKKVLASILKFQIEYFEKGSYYLKPMTMEEVADDIGMHESTVSRVSNGKYIQTKSGIFEIREFFTSGVSSEDGNEISSVAVKGLIKDLIEKEDKTKPLSDNLISQMLERDGIRVSRRTVAKYRDEMNILSSQMRRRM